MEHRPQFGECVILEFVVGQQAVIRLVGSPQHQLPEHIGRCRDTFISEAAESDLLSVTHIIVRRDITRFDTDNHQCLPIHVFKRERELRYGIQFRLGNFAEFLRDELRVFQPNHCVIIGHTENQRAAPSVGEGRYTLASAFRSVGLKLLFLVVVGCLSDQMCEVCYHVFVNLGAKVTKKYHKILIYRRKLMFKTSIHSF